MRSELQFSLIYRSTTCHDGRSPFTFKRNHVIQSSRACRAPMQKLPSWSIFFYFLSSRLRDSRQRCQDSLTETSAPSRQPVCLTWDDVLPPQLLSPPVVIIVRNQLLSQPWPSIFKMSAHWIAAPNWSHPQVIEATPPPCLSCQIRINLSDGVL